MDYELVLDLSDATIHTYSLNFNQLIQHLLPSFDLHQREKFFSSVQIKCNLNTASDPKIVSALQEFNNTRPSNLNDVLVKFKSVKRPSLNEFIRHQRQRNKQHKQRLRLHQKPNSNDQVSNRHILPTTPSGSSSSTGSPNASPSTTSPANSKKPKKNRIFAANNKLFKEQANESPENKKPLRSFLPSPATPKNKPVATVNNNNNNNGNNGNYPLGTAATPPPPSYDEVISQEHQQQPVAMETDDHDAAAPAYEPAIYPDLDSNGHFGLSEQQWRAQHDIHRHHYQPLGDDDEMNIVDDEEEVIVSVPRRPHGRKHSKPHEQQNRNQIEEEEEEEELKEEASNVLAPKVSNLKSQEDADLAFALSLQEQNWEDDMKMAMRLQKEEEERAKRERERRESASKYRNANFVDFGSRAGDYQRYLAHMYASQRSRSVHDDDDDNDGVHEHEEAVLENENEEGPPSRRWRPSRYEILLNSHGQIPAVFRRVLVDDEDAADLVHHAFAIHGLGGGRHGNMDDSWRRLPTRTLSKKDIAILSKSEEKKACPICMTEFVADDVTRQLPCFHEFHKDCVDKWFEQQNDKGKDASCPLDRKKIKEIANQHV
eukprot:CAMPEP_0197041820 /NCGR_PEP_ID=MMETSP1384-20130603/18299_1 /TAXON_ID=29189 /ORGANISM="Ammonia sp." /LENGTH=599 /DNA_ID=CAMNT_0042472807 /DNA_START=8 /DNA_END=1807 /DNA_ORIENTATION=-